MASKFPIVFHEGNAAANKNSNFCLYTEANVHKYASDSSIDFYTFKEEANDADSPEQSYVLLVIKNTGAANSLLNIDNIEILSNLSNNPFSLVTTFSGIGNVGTTGLSAVATLPSAITSATGYAALNPAPLGYVRINAGATTVANVNTEADSPTSSFGVTGSETYIPFYNPSSITTVGNEIGATSHDYGDGTQTYPHYASILVKCDPNSPMVITEGEVTLSITQSTGFNVSINLVMQAFNEGNLAYQQGFLTDSGDVTTSNSWSYTPNADFPTVTPIAYIAGPANSADLTSNVQGFASLLTAAPDVATSALTHNFFIGYMPEGFQYLVNNTLFGGLTNKDDTERVPCVKIFDNTATQGGIQFWNDGTSFPNGVVNPIADGDMPSGFMMEALFTDDPELPTVYIHSSTTSTINFQFATGISTSSAQILTANQVLYLVLDPKAIRNFNSYKLGDTVGRVPYVNAATLNSGGPAWRAQLNEFRVPHKDFFINTTNSGPTQNEKIQIVSGTYNPMGMNQQHSSRLFGKSYVTTSDDTLIYALADSDTLYNHNEGVTATNGATNHYRGDTSIITRDVYHKSQISSSLTGAVLDKIQDISKKNPTSNSSSNGAFYITKHLHIKDLFRFPEISASDTGVVASNIRPVVCWQNFNNEANFYAKPFGWNSSDYDDELLPTLDGASVGTLTKPISVFNVHEILTPKGIVGNLIRPSGHHVVATSGQESNTNSITSTGTDSQATNVFESATNFESLTISGVPLKQKSIALHTELIAGTLPNTIDEGFTQDNNSSETYKEMNWSSKAGGDEIGRYTCVTSFSIQPKVLLKASYDFNKIDSSRAENSFLTPISFLLYAHVYPQYSGDHLTIFGPNLISPTSLYYTTYGAATDALIAGTTYAAGDAVTSAHILALSQSLSIGDLNSTGASAQAFVYASGTASAVAYYKKYPFNGSGLMKFENYFASFTEITASGSSPFTSAYGIIPGPRRQGRYTAGGAAIATGSQLNKIYSADLNLNTAAGTYESFLPIEAKIDKAGCDYRIQLVNISLDNEMIPTNGTVPVLSNPLFEWDFSNQASSATEFGVPIADVATNPKTAPLTTFASSSNRTLATSTAVVDLGTNAAALGCRVSQLVTSSTASALNNGRTIVAVSGNNITLNAVPNSNQSGNQTLTFNWANKNYASWAIVHGSRAVSENTTLKIIDRTPSKKQYWQKYASFYVRPFDHNTDQSTWPSSAWDLTNRAVGAMRFMSLGSLRPSEGGLSTLDGVATYSQNESLIAQWTQQQANMNGFTDSANGTPHIYFGINRTIIEAANQTSGVFYNRVRIRYILHNKLENYGVHQEDINGLQFSENGKGHSFQTGAGTKAHVYEDSYLVKMNFNAVSPTLEISDVEGDVATGSATIDFGTIHS